MSTLPTLLDANDFKTGSATGGIQEAINALPNAAAVGGTVLTHGFTNYSATIIIASHSVTLRGDGPLSSILNYTGSGDAIKIGSATSDIRHVSLENLNISCANPTANGVNAIRTKHLKILNSLLDGSSGGSAVAILLDGSATAGAFSAFTKIDGCRIVDQWATAIRMAGSGSHEASNNDNLFTGNELQQLNSGTGTGIDMQTGNAWIIGGDIESYALGVHITGRGSIIAGSIEGCTSFVNFDFAAWSAAQRNLWIADVARNVPYTDTGNNNVIISPLKLTQMWMGS